MTLEIPGVTVARRFDKIAEMPMKPFPETGPETTADRAQRGSMKPPAFYVVLVHNDPVTPEGFVVDVLRRFFNKPELEASKIMALAQNFGAGVVGKYTFEIAETKAHLVNEFCREAGYPLFFSIEEE